MILTHTTQQEDTMHVTDHDDDAIIGQHINRVLADDSIDWTGYWPVVDPDDLTVIAISDGDDDHLVLADIVDGRVVRRDGASDVLIQRQGDLVRSDWSLDLMVKLENGDGDDDDLILCRSDGGDGGWSLHPAGSTDEQIASGDAPVLVSGPAQWDDDEGYWDRPNAQDYAEAVTSASSRQNEEE